ncbi:MAG: hypothetical protein IT258_03900 [Saprospiraceae bacterium]|nr:hypothetical protein [Saprospiraceae bacterium]
MQIEERTKCVHPYHRVTPDAPRAIDLRFCPSGTAVMGVINIVKVGTCH